MATIGQNASKKEKVEEYVEWDNFDYMRTIDADTLITRHREITDLEKALKAEKTAIAKELEVALIMDNQKAVRCADLLLVRCNGTTATIVSREKLVSNGVDVDLINACLEGGDEYTYVQVKRSNE